MRMMVSTTPRRIGSREEGVGEGEETAKEFTQEIFIPRFTRDSS